VLAIAREITGKTDLTMSNFEKYDLLYDIHWEHTRKNIKDSKNSFLK
jgi:hypothetical protein